MNADALSAQLATFAQQAFALLGGGRAGAQPAAPQAPRATPLGGFGGLLQSVFGALRGGGAVNGGGAGAARPQSILDALIGRFLPRGGGGPVAGGAIGGGAGGAVGGAGAIQPAPGGQAPGAPVDEDEVIPGDAGGDVEAPAADGDGVTYTTGRIATAGQGGGQADARGNLFVASEREVKIFDTNQRQTGAFPVPEGALDVAPSPDGTSAFVVSKIGDKYQPRRYEQLPNGRWQLDAEFRLEQFEFGGRMQDAEGMRISTDQQGNLYVADGMWASNSLNTVVKFDPNGKFLTRFGSFPDGNANDASSWEQGRFYWGLGGVAASPDGSSVYTTEVGNNRVQRWDLQADGNYAPAAMWGSDQASDPNRTGSSEPGRFAAPYDVGVDARGGVYVMNTSASQVQRFTREGEYRGSIDVHGQTDPARREAERTHGIAVDADGDVVSVESGIVARHG